MKLPDYYLPTLKKYGNLHVKTKNINELVEYLEKLLNINLKVEPFILYEYDPLAITSSNDKTEVNESFDLFVVDKNFVCDKVKITKEKSVKKNKPKRKQHKIKANITLSESAFFIMKYLTYNKDVFSFDDNFVRFMDSMCNPVKNRRDANSKAMYRLYKSGYLTRRKVKVKEAKILVYRYNIKK